MEQEGEREIKKSPEGTLHIRKCPFRRFGEFVETFGYDEVAGNIYNADEIEYRCNNKNRKRYHKNCKLVRKCDTNFGERKIVFRRWEVYNTSCVHMISFRNYYIKKRGNL